MSDTKLKLAPGVVTGDDLQKTFAFAQANEFALPAVNVTGSNTINAVLEAAREANAPVIIQFSNGGAAFVAGKGLDNKTQGASIAGAISGAHHVHQMAAHYGARVATHTDHAAKKLLPWVDGVLKASEEFHKVHGLPLFSSHMLDLSEEPLKENVETCKRYLERISAIGATLECEIGITGGEEDGVDNSGADTSSLYTSPEDVAYTYTELSAVSDRFTIAAAFGNVHGVYKAGNVVLRPEILRDAQKYVHETLKTASDKPVHFVFHGGSGSTLDKIREALTYGVVKMNVDTDMQWALWDGIRRFYIDKEGYLQGQIGNPDGEDKPNKKFYDPRVWLRHAEVSMTARLRQSFEDLRNIDRLE